MEDHRSRVRFLYENISYGILETLIHRDKDIDYKANAGMRDIFQALFTLTSKSRFDSILGNGHIGTVQRRQRQCADSIGMDWVPRLSANLFQVQPVAWFQNG